VRYCVCMGKDGGFSLVGRWDGWERRSRASYGRIAGNPEQEPKSEISIGDIFVLPSYIPRNRYFVQISMSIHVRYVG